MYMYIHVCTRQRARTHTHTHARTHTHRPKPAAVIPRLRFICRAEGFRRVEEAALRVIAEVILYYAKYIMM